MKKKHSKNNPRYPSKGASQHVSTSHCDFYSAGSPEESLCKDGSPPVSKQGRRTSRHQVSTQHRKEKMDPREKMAVMAILKATTMIILLVIAFFLLRKGISLYEEQIYLKHAEPDTSPVLKEIELVENFGTQGQGAHGNFADRIKIWQEADRMVRSADTLLQRNIYDQAIERCHDALRLDPSHMGALERLGHLYLKRGKHVEAVNTYIRLLSIDPSRSDMQKQLTQALDALGDAEAVVYMAQWYQEQNKYDSDIQRYLANAYYVHEEFAKAAEAYGRLLRDVPHDLPTLERQADAYMRIEQYDKAIAPLEILRVKKYQEQKYYQQLAACHAQLQNSREALLVLGRASKRFSRGVIVGWVQDPRFDLIRPDRDFQAFVSRLAGEDARGRLDALAAAREAEKAKVDSGKAELTTRQLEDELIQLK